MNPEDLSNEGRTAAERLKGMKGEKGTAPEGLGSRDADPWERPADRFLAEQAARVDPRRDAFTRLALSTEHTLHLHDLPGSADPVDARAAAARLADHARSDVPLAEAETRESPEHPAKYGDVDRPTLEYEPVEYEASRESPPGSPKASRPATREAN